MIKSKYVFFSKMLCFLHCLIGAEVASLLLFHFSSVTQSCLTLCSPVNCSLSGFPVHHQHPSVQFSSVTQSCPTLGDPMNHSTSGLPVHHQLPEFTQMIELVMPSSHLILCHPLLLLPVPPSITVFSNESTLRMRWPKYWSFSLSISPSNEHQDLAPLGWTGWISLQSKGLSLAHIHVH